MPHLSWSQFVILTADSAQRGIEDAEQLLLHHLKHAPTAILFCQPLIHNVLIVNGLDSIHELHDGMPFMWNQFTFL